MRLIWLLIIAGCGLAEPSDPDETHDTDEQSSGESGRLVGFTEAHNDYRAREDLAPLTWDDALADAAAAWTAYLAEERGCALEHDLDSPLGENLSWNWGWASDPYEVTAGWYSEISDYDYATNSCAPDKQCGHYTQVMWADTERLGCALQLCDDGAELWMCTYDPPGNVIGQRPW